MQDNVITQTHKWTVMAAVSMGIFLATIDGSIVNIALPTLVRSFRSEFSVVQWVVLAYLLTITTLMLSIGRLADIIGKKPLYAGGFVVFTVGSLLCGLSSTVYALIGFRVVQAIGAAMMMALGMAIVTEAFPPTERGKALGITGLMVSIGVIAGPTVGGLILDSLSWHWIFFVNLPIGIIGVALVLRNVPNLRPAGGQRFDFLGAVALFAALISLLMALTIGQQVGFGQPVVLGLFLGFAVFFAIFLVIERNHDQPMIDLSLFRTKLFSINLITGFFTFISSSGTILLMPFYLENVLGYSPREVGLLLVVVPVALGITAPISGALSDRFGTRPLTVIGLVFILIGYYAVSTLRLDTSSIGYMLRFLPIGIGMGIFQSPNNSAIMGTAPKNRLGVASGLLSITRTLGQTTGIAVLGALWASRVAALLDSPASNNVTDAPKTVQVAALNDTLMVVVGIIAVALGLSVYALVRERKTKAEGIVLAKANPSHNGGSHEGPNS